MQYTTDNRVQCFHCGEDCTADKIKTGELVFCCNGCKMVYQLLNQNGLCDYYTLNEQPGINRNTAARKDKFAFLDDESISAPLVTFRDATQTHITFYLPQVHCSSCLYLLENLHKLEQSIISCQVHFTRKEATIVFNHKLCSLRQVAELLTSIGYEPYISLHNASQAKPRVKKTLIYQLGIAGFCFANIMLLSFPEYLGLNTAEGNIRSVFRTLNLGLSLPVLLFSAQPFFESAWKSLRHGFLNIDAPIALAILVTFARSAYEVLSGTGAGYFDSMSGIVFFMLAGRVLQEKTYQQLSFERDYTAYFPVAVTVLKEDKEVATALPDIKAGDTLLVHSEELIPVDGILTRGKALIDYSFVTGESLPVMKEMGEIVYAGGRQTGSNIELLSIKEVTQSYLTGLWNRSDATNGDTKKPSSFVHLISRYFTLIVLGIAIIAAMYWKVHDPGRVWNAITAVMIVACPCALLLSSSFTNGNILRILGRNHFYLRNAETIEELANTNHIVFDKTGTLTDAHEQDITYEGIALSEKQQHAIAMLAAQSGHPLSIALAAYLPRNNSPVIVGFKDIQGMGIEGMIDDQLIAIGSQAFITGSNRLPETATTVYVAWENKVMGKFLFHNHYRNAIQPAIGWLQARYRLSVLSGDNDSERKALTGLFNKQATLLFRQMPQDKVRYVQQLQAQGDIVAMIGDGLNDAIALRESNVGIAVADSTNHFTPASDAIIDAKQLSMLPAFIQLCKANKRIVLASFILSIAYNVIGLFFAVQGNLSPLIAAILMPSSSLSILLITFGSSNVIAKWLKL